MTRCFAAALLIVGLSAPLFAQPVGTHLRLDTDPAKDMDLGARRIIPFPRKRSQDGVIVSSPYLCLASVRGKTQIPDEKKSLALPKRLLGRPLRAVEVALQRSCNRPPEIIATQHATVVSFLGKGKVELTPEEQARLMPFFPKLPRRITTLDARARAHLWAGRLLRLEAQVADLLALSDEGEVPSLDGRRPLGYPRFEIYLFSSEEAFEHFSAWFLPRCRPLVGKVVEDGLVPIPACALLIEGKETAEHARQFRHAATLKLVQRLRRKAGGIPDWLAIGLSHFMERRGPKPRKQVASALPADMDDPKDWDSFMADLVLAGKSGSLSGLTLTPETGLSLRSRVQAWSLTKFLIGVGRDRFTGLIRELLASDAEGEARIKGLEAALQKHYGGDMKLMESAWKRWVVKHKR